MARCLELTLHDLDLLAFPMRDFLSAKQDHIRNQVATGLHADVISVLSVLLTSPISHTLRCRRWLFAAEPLEGTCRYLGASICMFSYNGIANDTV